MLTGLGVLSKVNDEKIIYILHLGAEYFINETVSVGPKLTYENYNAENSMGSRDAIHFSLGFYFYL